MSRDELPGRPRLPLAGSVAVAVVSALLGSVWFVGPPAGAAAKLENRPVAQLPELTAKSLADAATYAELEQFAKDRVRPKPLAVESLNNLTEQVTGQSASSLILFGKQYSSDRPREVFSAGEFTNRCWPRPDIQVFRDVLVRVRDAAASSGREVVFMVAPSKYRTLGYLLGDRLASLDACAREDDAVIAQLAQEFPDVLVVVQPKRVLHYAPTDPYWAGDTHWTPTGAKAITEQVLMRVGNTTRTHANRLMAERLISNGVRVAGGLYRLAGMTKTTDSPLVTTAYEYRVRTQRNLKGTNEQTFGWRATRPIRSSDPSMLILHDSFINVPAVTRQFSSFVPRGFDVHWRNVADLAHLPAMHTVVVENVDRTFLRRLIGVSGVEDLEGQTFAIDELVNYLSRTK